MWGALSSFNTHSRYDILCRPQASGGFAASRHRADMATAERPEPRQSVVPGNGPVAQIVALLDRTGYQMVQENGQRHYGPPPDWRGDPPPRGCEVFIGKLPRDMFEDELVPLLETVGPIYELRLMLDFAGTNRGYAFATYTCQEDARRAARELDNAPIRRGTKRIGVCRSTDNSRLFVGGIPKSKTRQDVFDEMSRLTDGVVDVIVYSNVANRARNRGFAFVEYTDHKTAAVARRKMIPGLVRLWNVCEVVVDWAEPEPQVDDDVMSEVTVLYVRNLTLSTTESQLKEVFSFNGNLRVTKVKKIRDFAFIHYVSRSEASSALEELRDTELNGSVIEVAWSKPVGRNQNRMQRFRSRSSDIRRHYSGPPVVITSPSAAYGYDVYHRGFPHLPPIGTGRPVGSLGVPNSGHARGAGGMRGYRPVPMRTPPFYHSPTEPFWVDLQPGMQFAPTAQHIVFKPAFHAVQVLYDVCHKNGWGEPVFSLHPVPVSSNGSSSADSGSAHHQLYLYKVTLPDLPAGHNAFIPQRLSRSAEEAKEYAAGHVLGQLGIRPETPIGNAGYAPYAAFLPPGSPSVYGQRTSGSLSSSSSQSHSMSPPSLHMYGGGRSPHYGYDAAY